MRTHITQYEDTCMTLGIKEYEDTEVYHRGRCVGVHELRGSEPPPPQSVTRRREGGGIWVFEEVNGCEYALPIARPRGHAHLPYVTTRQHTSAYVSIR